MLRKPELAPEKNALPLSYENMEWVYLQAEPLAYSFQSMMMDAEIFSEKIEVVELLFATNHGILVLCLGQFTVRNLLLKVRW
jgi:hypothetical protein